MRKKAEVLGAEQEFFDRVWYDRKEAMLSGIRERRSQMPPEHIMDGMGEAMREVEAKYGAESLGPYTDFEWGMINGKLSALRWVMGDDWDDLDT